MVVAYMVCGTRATTQMFGSFRYSLRVVPYVYARGVSEY